MGRSAPMVNMLPYVLLIAGFVLLIKGADFLVNGASSIARRINVSDLVIGLTIVAFGTSTPELFVNIFASFKGNTDIAIGNVLGSNIANIFLILGVSAVIYPLTVTKGTVWKEIPFSLLAILVLGILANDRLIDKDNASMLMRTDGLVFLSFFMIFLYYSVSIAKRIEGMEQLVPSKQYVLAKSLLWVVLGLIGLTVGEYMDRGWGGAVGYEIWHEPIPGGIDHCCGRHLTSGAGHLSHGRLQEKCRDRGR